MEEVITVRSNHDLALMRQSGRITAKALKRAIDTAKPGVSLKEIDVTAEKVILEEGGDASFKTIPGYYWATCLTVNEEVVHGIPRDVVLREGDVLGIDLGAMYQGWHTDAAWSVVVGDAADSGKRRFLQVGEEALWKAIKQAVDGKKVGDISSAIQKSIEKEGYSVVKSLAGHGVGRFPHEEPEIPGCGDADTGPDLRIGMTLAIEVIYSAGRGDIVESSDGWTLSLFDNSLGGLFEMSVIVLERKPEILTDWRNV